MKQTKLEFLFTGRNVNVDKIVQANKIALSYGFAGISVNGSYLPDLNKLNDVTNIYVNLDTYTCTHPTEIMAMLCEFYVSSFKRLVSGFNISPIFRLKEKRQYFFDFNLPAAVCEQYNIPLRLFLNLDNYIDSDIHEICTVAEQVGIKDVVLVTRSLSVSDLITAAYSLSRQSSLNICAGHKSLSANDLEADAPFIDRWMVNYNNFNNILLGGV